uniref:Uncharacterized protein n=1 Tax=Sus scrofa TaxID=9823 RepID=A0A8D0SRW5_PIG
MADWNSCIGCLSTDGPAFITASILCVTSESICPCQLFTSTLQLSAFFFVFFFSILGVSGWEREKESEAGKGKQE